MQQVHLLDVLGQGWCLDHCSHELPEPLTVFHISIVFEGVIESGGYSGVPVAVDKAVHAPFVDAAVVFDVGEGDIEDL